MAATASNFMDRFLLQQSRTRFPDCLLFWAFYPLWILFLLLTIALSNTLIIILSPLQFLSTKLYRRYCEFFAWLCWPFFLYSLEIVGKNRIHFYGDNVPVGENAIVISNHPSYIDWMMTFALASRKDRLKSVKIQIKEVIKYIPFVGLAIKGIGFTFLSRNWSEDQKTLEKTFYTLKTVKEPFWLLSHPEGSRLSAQKLAECNDFAKKKDLPTMKHVLLPRVKGFNATVSALRDHVDAVYDLTIGYSSKPSNFLMMFTGLKPVDIHIYIRRYPIKEMPEDDQKLTEWLYKIYHEKDQLLDGRDAKGAFSAEEIGTDYFDSHFVPKIASWVMFFFVPAAYACSSYIL